MFSASWLTATFTTVMGHETNILRLKLNRLCIPWIGEILEQEAWKMDANSFGKNMFGRPLNNSQLLDFFGPFD